MKKTCVWTVALMLLAAAVWGQDDAVLLRYKYAPEQTIRTMEITKGIIPMTVEVQIPEDMPAEGEAEAGGLHQMTTGVDSTTTRVVTVDSVDPDGTAHARLRIEYMLTDSNMTVGDQVINTRMEYDDGEVTFSGDSAGQISEEQRAKLSEMLAREYSLVMDPLGGMEVTDAEYEKIYRGMFGPRYVGADLRKFTRAIGGLPEDPVQVGDTWEGDYAGGKEGGQVTGHSEMSLTDLTTTGDCQTAKIAGTATFGIQNTGELFGVAPGMGGMMGIAGMKTRIDNLNMGMEFEMAMDVGAGVVSQSSLDVTFEMTQTVTMDVQKPAEGEEQDDQPRKMTITTNVEKGKLHIERSTMSSVQEG